MPPVQLGHNLKQFSSYFIFWPTISLYIFIGSVSYLPYIFCIKQHKNNIYEKQQISKNNKFQKQHVLEKNAFESSNKFNKKTNFKKQQISKQIWKNNKLQIATNFKNNRFWFCFIPPLQILHNLLADRPSLRGAAGGAGGGPPCNSKNTTFKIFKKRQLLLHIL